LSIPKYFIDNYTEEGDVVFDPWSGKGTVPLEALVNKRIGIGNDKSPEAFILTHAKVNPPSVKEFKTYLDSLNGRMGSVKLGKKLSVLDRDARVFFSKSTFDQIRRVKELTRKDNTRVAIFTKAIVLGILHGSSSNALSLRCSHSYSMSPNYVKKYAKEHGLRRPHKKVIEEILRKGLDVLSDKRPKKKGRALNSDSRDIGLKDNSVDMILGSPPYFDAQTYAWGNWLRLWFLGHNYKDVRSILTESGSKLVYGDFMRESSKELYRVLKPGGRCFIVVGDVNKRKKAGVVEVINTAEFILPGLLDAGFRAEKIVIDSIPQSKRVMTHKSKDAGIKTERIIYLTKPN